MLILAQHNWPAAISVHLWGFAMLYASQIRNSTLREGETRTALQKFTRAPKTSTPNANIFHTFGCPVYNLDPRLQSGGSLEHKWSERARIGIYLGLSREHASSVSIVLNPDTGLTSPQFHVKHDERFETTGIPAMRNIGKWQGLTRIKEKPKGKAERKNKRQKLGEILKEIELVEGVNTGEAMGIGTHLENIGNKRQRTESIFQRENESSQSFESSQNAESTQLPQNVEP